MPMGTLEFSDKYTMQNLDKYIVNNLDKIETLGMSARDFWQ